jgi:hypothetical protein
MPTARYALPITSALRNPMLNADTGPRKSLSDIAEYPNQPLSISKSTSRRRADSLQPRASSPPYPRRSANIELSSKQAVISAYLRSSYHDDDGELPRRFSSAEYDYSPSAAHHNSQPEIRRLSGNFNAPTNVELERHQSHKRTSWGMSKLKSAVRGLVRA